MHKFVLQPKEEGNLEIALDASRFIGSKTRAHWLTMRRGDRTEEFTFRITAFSERVVIVDQ